MHLDETSDEEGPTGENLKEYTFTYFYNLPQRLLAKILVRLFRHRQIRW